MAIFMENMEDDKFLFIFGIRVTIVSYDLPKHFPRSWECLRMNFSWQEFDILLCKKMCCKLVSISHNTHHMYSSLVKQRK